MQNQNNGYEYTKQSFELIEEGDYEAQITTVELKTTNSGKEYMSITFKIRDDVEQKYQNRYVFDSIWKERENPTFYNRRRINQLLGTQHFEEGTVFSTIQEVITNLMGTYLIVHVTKTYDDYRQAEINRVAYYKSSQKQPKTVEAGEIYHNGVAINNGNDLPF